MTSHLTERHPMVSDTPARVPYDAFYFAGCWLGGPQATLGEFADRSTRLLSGLVALHPAFRQLHLVGDSRKDSPLLAGDLSNLRPWVLHRSWYPGAPSNARYSHQKADGSLSLQSRGDLGFSLELGNLRAGPDKLQLMVTDGAPARGGVQLTIPQSLAEVFASTAFFRQLIELLRASWSVRFGVLYSASWDEAVNPAPPAQDLLPIGGITYCSDGTLVEAVPAGTRWLATGDGGVVFTITERPDRLEPAALTEAKGLRAALAAHGMLALR